MKRTLIKLVKYLMVPAGAAWSLMRPAGRIRILMYHRVDDAVRKELAVTREDFRWQMDFLKRRGYKVVTLDEALRLSGNAGRDKYAVLTFDDGYEDFCRNALPVLLEYGFPATVYLVPGAIGGNGVFWWDRDLGESRLMSWEQITQVKGSPLIEFGSHTMTHPDLNKLSEQDAWAELSRSKAALLEKLGVEARHFAYPRGIMTQPAREAARKLYRTAVSIFDGNDIDAAGSCDPMMLRRVPVQGSDGKSLFRARLNGWLVAEEWIKKLMGRH